MLAMDQIHRIRELFYQQDLTLSDIAKAVGCDWRTVRKYVDMEDFNSKPPEPEEASKSKLNKYKPTIDEWLIRSRNAQEAAAYCQARLSQAEGDVPG